MPPPAPSDQSEEESTIISAMLDTLLSLGESDDEDSDSSTITQNSSYDEVLEYTSRILNLNDSSKEEVMDMLEKSSDVETNLTDEEKSNILKSSLNSVLSDSNNYNRVSFYASFLSNLKLLTAYIK